MCAIQSKRIPTHSQLTKILATSLLSIGNINSQCFSTVVALDDSIAAIVDNEHSGHFYIENNWPKSLYKLKWAPESNVIAIHNNDGQQQIHN
ncbi:hypothetical protein BLOT_001395 [Blomia tropicalis]|nr:hypothetical protein BLOT_001395 [Blomia tropicalis]